MPEPELDQIRQLLKSGGLRVTTPRTTVLQALLAAAGPVTQEQIAQALGKKAPNKVTIYRTLEAFIEADLVHRAFLKDRTWYFEPAHRCSQEQCHPHFSCTRCGRTDCLTEMKMPMAPPVAGYIVQHQRVQLEGLCPRCKAPLHSSAVDIPKTG
ncbi:MAG: transcriptional repressor [Phycisphaerae bacterium]|nr:transcriptional repressor [Phycisphaerae bacterium]